jgi:hypothetical protein
MSEILHWLSSCDLGVQIFWEIYATLVGMVGGFFIGRLGMFKPKERKNMNNTGVGFHRDALRDKWAEPRYVIAIRDQHGVTVFDIPIPAGIVDLDSWSARAFAAIQDWTSPNGTRQISSYEVIQL